MQIWNIYMYVAECVVKYLALLDRILCRRERCVRWKNTEYYDLYRFYHCLAIPQAHWKGSLQRDCIANVLGFLQPSIQTSAMLEAYWQPPGGMVLPHGYLCLWSLQKAWSMQQVHFIRVKLFVFIQKCFYITFFHKGFYINVFIQNIIKKKVLNRTKYMNCRTANHYQTCRGTSPSGRKWAFSVILHGAFLLKIRILIASLYATFHHEISKHFTKAVNHICFVFMNSKV